MINSTGFDFDKAAKSIRKVMDDNFIQPVIQVEKIITSFSNRTWKHTTIVIWADGTKTLVTKQDCDSFDVHAAFTAALAKKLYGSSSAVWRVIDENIVLWS